MHWYLDIDLDEGETACINLALAISESVLLIMDEKAGWGFAKEKGIKVVRTAAIIGMAKHKGLIPSAHDVFKSCLNLIFVFLPRLLTLY